MVAIAKAGGIIVPINNRLALPEILYILEDANPFAIIYTPDSRTVIAQTHISPKIIKIISGSPVEGESNINALMSAKSVQPPPFPETGSDDALLCYTSGTTGHPQGVISTHPNIVVGQ